MSTITVQVILALVVGGTALMVFARIHGRRNVGAFGGLLLAVGLTGIYGIYDNARAWCQYPYYAGPDWACTGAQLSTRRATAVAVSNAQIEAQRLAAGDAENARLAAAQQQAMRDVSQGALPPEMVEEQCINTKMQDAYAVADPPTGVALDAIRTTVRAQCLGEFVKATGASSGEVAGAVVNAVEQNMGGIPAAVSEDIQRGAANARENIARKFGRP